MASALWFVVKWTLVCLGAGALFYNYARKWNLPTALAICLGPFALIVIDRAIARWRRAS